MTSLKRKPHIFIGVIAIILIVVNVIACGGIQNAPLSSDDATSTASMATVNATMATANATISSGWATTNALSTQQAQIDAQEAQDAALMDAQDKATPQFLKQFSTLANLHNPGPPYSPYISGKVVIINRVEKSLEDLLELGLPTNLTATTPDEVGTVIWLDCQGQVLSWKYIGGYDAIWYYCDVTIIDKTENTVVGVKHFDGEYPPPVVEGSMWCCYYPYDDMAKYVGSLPRY
jgi:hypothetical protein